MSNIGPFFKKGIKLKIFLFVVVQSYLASYNVIFQPNLCLSLTCSSIHLVTIWRKNKSRNLTKVTIWQKNKSHSLTKEQKLQLDKSHNLTKEQKSQFDERTKIAIWKKLLPKKSSVGIWMKRFAVMFVSIAFKLTLN